MVSYTVPMDQPLSGLMVLRSGGSMVSDTILMGQPLSVPRAPKSGGSMESGTALMGQLLSGLMATESGTSMGNILDQMTGAFGLDGSFCYQRSGAIGSSFNGHPG
jgi:hypothetical protein